MKKQKNDVLCILGLWEDGDVEIIFRCFEFVVAVVFFQNLFLLFGFGGDFLLASATFAALAAVPVVDHLGRDDAVDKCRDDVREDHHRIARLLNRSEDAGSGSARQQENRHGRQLARAALTVVGNCLDHLHMQADGRNNNISIKEIHKNGISC